MRFNRTNEENKKRQLQYGEVFTPLEVIDEMVSLLELRDGLTICEPCAGEGHFITTRYNPLTGESVPKDQRVGVLDRLLMMGIDNFKIYMYDIQQDNIEECIKNVKATLLEYGKCELFKNFFIDKIDVLSHKLDVDYVITNPPYQLPLEAHGTNDNVQYKPVYHKFMQWGINTAKVASIMITPARFLGKIGNGIDKKWIQSLLDSPHFRVVRHIRDEHFFKGAEIRGGVAIHEYNKKDNFEPVRLFLWNPLIKSIALKARQVCDKFMNDIIISGGQYNTNEFKRLSERLEGGQVVVFASKGTRLYRTADKPLKKVNKYKLLITKKYNSKRNGAGRTMIIGTDYEYSKSFNAIYCDTIGEAKYMEKYVHTQIVTVLLQALKLTAGQDSKVWYYVPQPQEISKLWAVLNDDERRFIWTYTNRWEV